MDDKGLNEKIDDIYKHLKIGEDKKKKKGKEITFKLPLWVKMQHKTISKQSKVMVFLMGVNGNVNIKISEIKNGMINIGDKFYSVTPGAIYMYNNIPTIFLPEWTLEPIGTKDYLDSDNKSDAQAIIIRAIETKEAGIGKKLGGKALIWIGLIVIVGAYILFGGS